MHSYTWNPDLYNQQHSFVAKYGESVLPLLDARAGETILDLGCGTGTLTKQIAASGAEVIGIDSSETMLSQARLDYPELTFLNSDAHNFKLEHQLDAVFSNAALHWMLKPDQVINSVWQALKPKGRFVFEMGGKGNTETIEQACEYALAKLGYPIPDRINLFPSLAEFSRLLEQQGFTVSYALYFERPTLLAGEDGLRQWIKMLRNNFLIPLTAKEQVNFFELAEEFARPKLLNQDGNWIADYKRLRMLANKA